MWRRSWRVVEFRAVAVARYWLVLAEASSVRLFGEADVRMRRAGVQVCEDEAC